MIELDNLTNPQIDKLEVVESIVSSLESQGYHVFEVNSSKPWGAYVRIENADADKFIAEYFPGLSPSEARMGMNDAQLSPKILIVSPGQRLSWQYHDRRAERWAFLNSGSYCKNLGDDEVEPITANAGEVVQFKEGERHRLIGAVGYYSFVAEIWQHSNPEELSDEDDIVRLQDDYAR